MSDTAEYCWLGEHGLRRDEAQIGSRNTVHQYPTEQVDCGRDNVMTLANDVNRQIRSNHFAELNVSAAGNRATLKSRSIHWNLPISTYRFASIGSRRHPGFVSNNCETPI